MNPIDATRTGKSNTDYAFVVDTATPADQAAIAANLENVQHWLASRDVALGSAPFVKEWIERKIAGGEFYVARNRGIPIGTLRLLWANPDFRGDRCQGDAASIHALPVRRDYQGAVSEHASRTGPGARQSPTVVASCAGAAARLIRRSQPTTGGSSSLHPDRGGVIRHD